MSDKVGFVEMLFVGGWVAAERDILTDSGTGQNPGEHDKQPLSLCSKDCSCMLPSPLLTTHALMLRG